MKKQILLVFGTRPEAVKMCPLAMELKRHKEFDVRVCLTGQHREMLKQVMDAFDVRENDNLDVMHENQTLTGITNAVLSGMEGVLAAKKPDLVLVHGDTTTSYAAALAAFYGQIPVGHVEAGLRSGNLYSPFPEELNRLMTDRISVFHFAPTTGNRDNLLREGIAPDGIFVTGNTVIDAFATTVKKDYTFRHASLRDCTCLRGRLPAEPFSKASPARVPENPLIVLTAHRRENRGEPFRNIFRAVKRITEKYPDATVVYPVHPSPAVKDAAYEMLGGVPRVLLTEPLDVFDMHNLLARCDLVLTDSGGLQEEAPAFGKPVLVLRTETERPEAVTAGTVEVTGVDGDVVFERTSRLLDDAGAYAKMACAVNPYGDGHACERIAEALLTEFAGHRAP